MGAKHPAPSHKVSGQTIYLAAAIMVSIVAAVAMVVFGRRGGDGSAEAAASRLRLEDIPFNGTRAYQYLKQISDIGPRRSGSPGMAAQQKLLVAHFQKLGGQVELQRFDAPDPRNGAQVHMANLIARWNPEAAERILLCAHYDTLPLPMRDPDNPRGTFIGANDGASGVAVLMELAHDLAGRQAKPSKYGVDLVCFDGEEYIFTEQDPFFLGAEHFARTYAGSRRNYRYKCAVLLDMVGDADLQIYQDHNSVSWPDTRPLVGEIWGTAARLGVREFIPRRKYEIRDDHLPLHEIAKIPACDIIDFDYPFWHTQGDTPDKCSALSLAKVGWVVSEWLKEKK